MRQVLYHNLVYAIFEAHQSMPLPSKNHLCMEVGGLSVQPEVWHSCHWLSGFPHSHNFLSLSISLHHHSFTLKQKDGQGSGDRLPRNYFKAFQVGWGRHPLRVFCVNHMLATLLHIAFNYIIFLFQKVNKEKTMKLHFKIKYI